MLTDGFEDHASCFRNTVELFTGAGEMGANIAKSMCCCSVGCAWRLENCGTISRQMVEDLRNVLELEDDMLPLSAIAAAFSV